MRELPVSDNRELESLQERIERLSPPDILRLAAMLLEERRPHEALALIDKVSLEMHFVLVFSAATEEPSR